MADAEPAAQPRQNAAHGASRGSTIENDPVPKERKNPEHELQENELKRAQAAIAGAERGNWRDLRTVFEFAGISAQNKRCLNVTRAQTRFPKTIDDWRAYTGTRFEDFSSKH